MFNGNPRYYQFYCLYYISLRYKKYYNCLLYFSGHFFYIQVNLDMTDHLDKTDFVYDGQYA